MKSLTSFAYKTLTAFVVVMLALTATPVTPAFAASTGFSSPTACTTGGYTNPAFALTSNDQRAVSDSDDETLSCSFNIPAIPAGSVIVGIEVRVEGSATTTRDLSVDLSWNAGGNHTGGDPTIDLVVAEQIFTVGGTTNTWGRIWAVGDFTAANFRVRLTSDDDAGNLSVDHVQVNVHYASPTTTALISSLNPSNAGDSVTFTATVTSTSGTPTGTVTFIDSVTGTLGVGALNASGVATLITNTLTVGTHNITAAYGGDTNFAGSTSPILVQNVSGPPTIISANNATFTVGNAGSFTVTTTGYPASTFTLTGDPLPAGVNFNTTTGELSGTPTLGTNAVDVYNLVITASNGINPDATQNFTLTVIKRNQTISNFNPPGSAGYGTSFNVSPTASSGLLVTVTVTAPIGCTISTNTVTMTSSTVNCNLTATQAGNDDYNSVTLTDSVTAQRAVTTVSVSPSPHDDTNPSQSFYSHPMTFTITVTSPGGTPTGNVTMTGGTPAQNQTVTLVGGVAQITLPNPPNYLNVLYSGGTGAYLPHGGNVLVCAIAGVPCPGLVFSYGGDANFNGDSENVAHIVYPAPTQVAVTSNINPSAVGQQVTFTVNVSTTAPGTGIPPGTVTIWDGLVQIGGPITLVNGVGTFNTSALAFGSHNITARFTSTSVNFASNNTSNTLVQNVSRATTTALASDNNPSVYGENVTFTATVTSTTPGTITGSVTFRDGVTTIGTDTTIVGGVATFTTNSLIVGTHPITAVYSGDGTYATSTSAVVNQVVDPATLTVRAVNETIVYGDADPSPFTFTYTGFVLSQTSAVINTPPTCDVLVAHVNVGTYPITCSGAVDDNYIFNYAPPPGPVVGTLTITQKPLTITATDQGKVVGVLLTFPDPSTAFTTIGLLPGDDVTGVTLFSTGAPAAANAGTYDIVPSNAVGTGLGNYAITYANGTLTVGTTILTITANDQTKTYGDVFTFAGVQYTVSGLLPGHSVTSVTLFSAGALATADVGTYDIVPSAAVGVGLNNYSIIYVNGTMTVTPRNLTFIPNDESKVYGSVFSLYTGAFNPINGIQNGDNITPVYNSAGAVATAPVGAYPITVTLNDPDGRLGNYNVPVNLPTATLTVTPKPLTVTANNQTKSYGTLFTFAGTEFTTNGLTNGDTVTSVTLTSAGALANAAVAGSPYPIVPSAALGAGLTNYTISYVNGTMTITRPTLTVTSDGQTKIYGDVFPIANFTGSIAGIQNGDPITVTYASGGVAANALVGSYPITITLNAPAGILANYIIDQTVGNLVVVRRDLTVTADNLSKVYGDPVTLTGVVGGAGVVLGDNITFTYSSPGTVLTAPVGTYTIAITLNDPLGMIGNYNYTATPGTLTVTQRDLVVTPADQSKQYGTWFLAFTGNITGIQNGDNITANYASVLGSPPSAPVGTYDITATLNDPTGKLGNYNVTLNIGTLTVSSSVVTVTADAKTMVYGDPDPAFTFTYFGLAAGDTPAVINVPPTCTVVGPHADVGTYTNQIVCSGAADDAYTFAYVPGTLTVTPRTLTVTPGSATKIYGSLFNAFTGNIAGIQNGDAITATYTSPGSVPAATVAGSPYLITATLNAPAGVLANYTVTLNTGTLTVTPRDLVIQPGDKIKAFGTVFSAFTGSIIGIQNGDAITATYNSTGAPAAAAVGLYPITAVPNATPAVLANYTVSIGTATLTVVIADQTITVTIPAPGNAANGANFTVAATASSNLGVVYSATGACSNIGAVFTITAPTGICVVHYNQPGDTDFGPAPEVTENVTALPNGQTITVVTPAPTVASPGSVFDVEATASSGLIVSITASGVCTIVDNGDGTARITIVAPNGTCVVHYNQAGDATFASAPQITESITVDSTAPTVTVNQAVTQTDPTNVSPINFTVVFSEPVTDFISSDVTVTGTAGATTAIVTGAGTTYNVEVSGMANDGTVIVTIPAGVALDIAGNDNFASTSTDNTVTYFDGNGPTVQVINTSPETPDHVLSSAEILTFDITHLVVKFNQDVYNPPGDSDADDVTNPNNYILIRDLGDTPGVQTISCSTGAVVPADTNIAIGTVIYDNATHTATFTINSGLPLSNGDYHLFVCGTTSIVDPLDNTLALVGSAGLPSTDFRGSFTVNIVDNGGGGGGGGGGNGNNASTRLSSGVVIPVTGFAPGKITTLPKQPADKAYKALGDLTIEIPTLGIKYPIIGVSLINDNWDLTWMKDSVGYLDGSAYPTFNGNTVLTAHVLDSNNNLGPFSDIKGMQMGDRVYIHFDGKIYIYEVQENRKIRPFNISAVFKHQEYSWITLVTCEDYNPKTGHYSYRRMVRAVLISVVSER